jgi:hypothetical protein
MNVGGAQNAEQLKICLNLTSLPLSLKCFSNCLDFGAASEEAKVSKSVLLRTKHISSSSHENPLSTMPLLNEHMARILGN